MTTETNTTKSFRTPKDEERTKRAAEVVAKAQAAVDAAQSTLDAAEGAYVDDPSEKNIGKARDARRAFEDAARDLDLARSHAAKVEGQIATTERAAIAAEIARLEEARGREVDCNDGARRAALVDDRARMLAVEIGILRTELQTLITSRRDQLEESFVELNSLRSRIGVRVSERTHGDGADSALLLLARLTDAAQTGQNHGLALEPWEGFGDLADLRKRVLARRAAIEKSSFDVTKAADVAKAAVVSALAVASALTLTGGH